MWQDSSKVCASVGTDHAGTGFHAPCRILPVLKIIPGHFIKLSQLQLLRRTQNGAFHDEMASDSRHCCGRGLQKHATHTKNDRLSRSQLGQAILDLQEPRCRVARLEELEWKTLLLSHMPDQKWDVCKSKLLNMGCKWPCANMRHMSLLGHDWVRLMAAEKY